MSQMLQHFYWVSEGKRKTMNKEIKYMLDHSIAEPSTSSRASPCLLVDKTDKSPKFCTDDGKINTVTGPEAFPLHMED